MEWMVGEDKRQMETNDDQKKNKTPVEEIFTWVSRLSLDSFLSQLCALNMIDCVNKTHYKT